MSSQELHQHLARYLEFDIDRAIEIGTLHEQYLAEYTQLRENRIRKWLQSAPGFQSGMAVPEIGKIRAYVFEQQAILSAIRKLDDRLFSQLSGLFGDDEFSSIERARKSRVRTRSRGGMAAAMGMLSAQDLWSTASEVDLEPQDLSALSTALVPWEERITPLTTKAAKAASSVLLKLAEKLEEVGITGEEFNDFDQSDPEQIQRLQEFMMLMQQIFLDVRQESESINAELRRVNSRIVRDIDKTMEPWAARRFKKAFFENYPTLTYITPDFGLSPSDVLSGDMGGASSMFLIKSSRLLEQDLRPLIESIRASQLFSDEVCSDFAERCHGYLMDDHDRLNSIIKIQANIDPIREAMRENAELISVGGGDSEGGLDSSGVSAVDLISELRQERNQLKIDLLHDLVRFLDLDSLAPGEFRSFSRAIMDLGSSPEPWETEDFSSSSIGSTSFVMGELIKVPWMSAPIGSEVLDFFSKEPGGHELILPVIAAIHRDYLDSWNDYVTPLINSYHATDPEDTYQDEVPIDWEASAIEVDARRAAARDSMRSIDSEFFADLLSIAPSEMAPSIHLLRYERFVDLALAGSGYEPRTFEHAPLKQSSNVVAVLCDLDLDPAVHSLIVSRLSSELDGLLLAQEAIYKERASLSMKNRQRMRGHLAMAESGESETTPAESFEERYGKFNRLGALPALRVQVADSERAITDKVISLLPEEMHDRFHHELRIRCYPAVYLPDDRIESAFEVIGRSEDISPEQMDEIGVLTEAFTREWMRFGDQIIECKESIPSLDALGVGDQMSSMMEYSTRSEQLFFDRGELAMMTLRRIAEVLDSRQQLQIPALQELGSSQQPISSQLQVEASLDEP